jgi:molybdenum cofactor cytidylyltransferase
MGKYAIIILAAGSSSRFGYAKQLADHNGKSLIQHALSEATKVTENVILVLGANAEIIKKEIENTPARLVYNKDWEEGMSSSIRCGLSDLLKKNAEIGAVIFMVCDQPFVTSSLVNELITKHEETKKTIVASAYQETTGTPVLFDKTFFQELLALTGQSGAKKIISQNPDSTIAISFPLGYIDIDTKDDYEALQKNKFNS